MQYLYLLTVLVLIISLLADRRKTAAAVRIAAKKLVKIMPAILTMIIFVSLALAFISEETMSHYLQGNNNFIGVGIALAIGSITLMPGFVAFPLCGILLNNGVKYIILSAFSTSLMMVGILTYPMEKAYFGAKITIIRNIISLMIAFLVALFTGIIFGEVF